MSTGQFSMKQGLVGRQNEGSMMSPARIASTPPRIDSLGDKYWENAEGQRHRLDGPAVELANGDKYWHQNDRLHRLDGPAIELANGIKSWYIKGKRLFRNVDYLNTAKLISMVQDQLMKSSGRALLDQASNGVPGSKEVLLDYLLENNLIDPPKGKEPFKDVEDVISIYGEFKANGVI